MNLKQLSQLLGLSPTTVSRALNGYPEVSLETRKRVVEAARQHGYQPNSTAQRLATGRSKAIGHVLPLVEEKSISPIFADFIAGAGETYRRFGYNMLIDVTRSENEAEHYRDLARSGAVDGCIVHGPILDEPRIDILQDLGLPFLVHGRASGTEGYSWLDFNNQSAFETLTQHLTDLGHRRIALLNGPEAMSFAKRRRNGVEDALARVGAHLDADLTFSAEMTEPFGYETTKDLLQRDAPPTAILTSSLFPALGISRALAEAGLTQGRDVSVATHDDALSFLPNGQDRPVFTSTRSSIRDAGRRCAEMLIDQIEGRAAGPQSELWEAELIIGSSTGPAPV